MSVVDVISQRSSAPVLIQVLAASGVGDEVHHQRVQRAPVLMRSTQHLQLASSRRERARELVPRALFITQPLQHLQLAFLRC